MSITGYRQYMRKYRLIVDRKSGGGIDVSDLRCTFSCEKSMTATPNFSQITIYNLNQDTIASIKAGDTVLLEAGYEGGNYGMIFTGQIVQPYTAKESGTDLALVLLVQDGDVYLNGSFTAETVGKNATPLDIVNVCMGQSTDVGLISDELSSTRLARGRVLFGKSAKYIKSVAQKAKSQFYVEDGKVNVVAAKDYDENTAVELNPATGLVGTPSQTDDGVSGQCLINPSIKLNTLLYINSGLVNAKRDTVGGSTTVVNTDGVYRVVKLTYEGDTRGDAWYCNFEAVTQAGTKLAGQSSDVTSPWR